MRAGTVAALRAMQLDDATLGMRARHPEFGAVTLSELLSTWVVHDLGHLRQIARTLARRWSAEVGPWRAYLPVLDD